MHKTASLGGPRADPADMGAMKRQRPARASYASTVAMLLSPSKPGDAYNSGCVEKPQTRAECRPVTSATLKEKATDV